VTQKQILALLTRIRTRAAAQVEDCNRLEAALGAAASTPGDLGRSSSAGRNGNRAGASRRHTANTT
jgi:hypothetical protein